MTIDRIDHIYQGNLVRGGNLSCWWCTHCIGR